MAIKITKKQEYVDDVGGKITYLVEDITTENNYGEYFSTPVNDYIAEFSLKQLLELKEALNNLDIK